MKKKSLFKLEVNLQNYIITNKILENDYSLINQVKNKETQEISIAKTFKLLKFSEEEKNKIIDTEVQILTTVNHPALIKILGYSKTDFQNDKNPTLILEKADNGSLDILLNNVRGKKTQKISDNAKIIILLGIARGMKYLHDRSIVHLDLSPSNILLDKDYHAIITDFGLSQFKYNYNEIKPTFFGDNLIYMSPEYLQKSKIDNKTDVYSFGIVMYEVITGLFPYPDLMNNTISIQDFIQKVVSQNYRPNLNNIKKHKYRDLVSRCLSVKSADRPTFDEIFDVLFVNVSSENNYIKSLTAETDNIDKKSNENKRLRQENSQLSKEILFFKSQNKELEKSIKQNEDDYNRSIERKKALFQMTKKLFEYSQEISETLENYTFDMDYQEKIKEIIMNDCPQISEEIENLALETEKMTEENEIIPLKIENMEELVLRQKEENSLLYKNIETMKRQIEILKISNEQPLSQEKDRKNKIFGKKPIVDKRYLTEYEISSKFNAINDKEFKECEYLTKIIIPSSILKIGRSAFKGCASLREINIPSSVQRIDKAAFSFCFSIKVISIPSSVKFIGDFAFESCIALQKAEILSNEIEVGESIFESCTALEEIKLPSILNLDDLGIHISNTINVLTF